MHSRTWHSLAFVFIVALFPVLAISCGTPDRPVIEAQLLPPPAVPPPILRGPAHVVVHLEAVEQKQEIAPGVTYTTWSFNGTVPGPMIRVRVGDTVEVHLKNSGTMAHNIDLHAVNGPGGGAGATTVNPGEEKSFTFKAKAAGLFVYHCASGVVADHIANGMYGAILVEPTGGLDKVDKEFYVGQSEFYTTGATGAQGDQSLDFNKLLAETPTYVVFNGNAQSLIGDKALKANVGDNVRIFFVDGGPNLISSFHVIGEIFDKAWNYGTLESSPLQSVQTILVPSGGATIVQFQIDVPGDYKLVDHSISRVSLGAVGTLHADGPANPDVFDAGAAGAAASSHDMGVMTPTPATPMPAPTASSAAASSPTASSPSNAAALTLTDNAFSQRAITVAAGTKVTFQLSNQGKVPHNMQIAPADGNFDSKSTVNSSPELIYPGTTATLTWTAPATPGTYQFRCEVHPTEMTGTITVK